MIKINPVIRVLGVFLLFGLVAAAYDASRSANVGSVFTYLMLFSFLLPPILVNKLPLFFGDSLKFQKLNNDVFGGFESKSERNAFWVVFVLSFIVSVISTVSQI